MIFYHKGRNGHLHSVMSTHLGVFLFRRFEMFCVNWAIYRSSALENCYLWKLPEPSTVDTNGKALDPIGR